MKLGKFYKVQPADEVVEAQNNAKGVVWQQRPPELLSSKEAPVALAVDVDFVFAIAETRRRARGGKNPRPALNPGDYHAQAPDRGNLLKMLEDVLEAIAYADDCVVADGRVRKLWGDVDETRVRVTQLCPRR